MFEHSDQGQGYNIFPPNVLVGKSVNAEFVFDDIGKNDTETVSLGRAVSWYLSTGTFTISNNTGGVLFLPASALYLVHGNVDFWYISAMTEDYATAQAINYIDSLPEGDDAAINAEDPNLIIQNYVLKDPGVWTETFASAAPEPDAYIMMLIGISGAGIAIRNAKRKAFSLAPAAQSLF